MKPRCVRLTLITIVLCAVLSARAVAALLTPAPALPVTVAAVPASRPAPVRSGDLARVFPVAPSAPVLPRVPAELIATSVGSIRYATVRVTSTEVQGAWTAGETIPGVGRIARIGGTSIDVVDERGGRATLSLFDPSVAGHAVAATTGGPATDSTFEIDRAAIRDLVTGATKLEGVRLVPLVREGEVRGLRVMAVAPGSIAATVGLRSGDLLEAIDGERITTAQQLIDLYATLDARTSLELQGTRGGAPLAITLRLR